MMGRWDGTYCRMVWYGMGRGGMGWDWTMGRGGMEGDDGTMEWYGMGWDRMGRGAMGWGMLGWDGVRWDRLGWVG